MGTIVGTILTALAVTAAGAVCLKVSKNRQRREAEGDVDAARKRIEGEKAELRRAVFEQDDERVNAAVSRFLAAFVALGAYGGILAAGSLIEGCRAARVEVAYVSADRRIVSVTNEAGVACKQVPDVVFAEMLEKMAEFEALKREKAVERRLN